MAAVPVIEGYSDPVLVAQGGFGFVYRARQDRFGRVVALKVLKVDGLDDHGIQRFERECVAMGSLSWHPNVVALHDSGITTDGHPFLAMEYLESGSLGDQLRDGPLPWREAVAAGVQVAGALGAAHALGTLHRDLKPENLLVGHFGEIKLGDFGIAAVEGTSRTTTGHAAFTVVHVAPEILEGHRPDELTDLYSLASTLYTLIAASAPFAGEADEPPASLMIRVLREPAPRLSDAPVGLIDLVARTLSKDRDERPQSAAAFGRALQEVQESNGEPLTVMRLTPSLPSTEPDQSPAPEPGAPLADGSPAGDPRPTIRSAEILPVEGATNDTIRGGGSPTRENAAVPPPLLNNSTPPIASRPAAAEGLQEARTSDSPGGREAPKGARVAVLVGVVGLLALLGIVAANVFGTSDDTSSQDTTTRGSDGNITEGGDVGVFALDVGDCFDQPPDGNISEVAGVPCADPHDTEVYAKFDMEGGDDAPYPGDAAVRTASEECIGALFEDYVGLDYATSRFQAFPITPTQETWESDLNDREIICTANTVDGTQITGSIQGTAE